MKKVLIAIGVVGALALICIGGFVAYRKMSLETSKRPELRATRIYREKYGSSASVKITAASIAAPAVILANGTQDTSEQPDVLVVTGEIKPSRSIHFRGFNSGRAKLLDGVGLKGAHPPDGARFATNGHVGKQLEKGKSYEFSLAFEVPEDFKSGVILILDGSMIEDSESFEFFIPTEEIRGREAPR
jgi:hypothetical protein